LATNIYSVASTPAGQLRSPLDSGRPSLQIRAKCNLAEREAGRNVEVMWLLGRLEEDRQLAELGKRYADLSDGQRQVMDLAIQGQSNKEIAAQLAISPRTVEHYRESAMERMQASRFAEFILKEREKAPGIRPCPTRWL
jgi:DNA-binding CsgD family transcriptional regulator